MIDCTAPKQIHRELIFLIGGAVVLVIGIVLAIIIWRINNKEIVQPPAESLPIDVTTFDDKPKTPLDISHYCLIEVSGHLSCQA